MTPRNPTVLAVLNPIVPQRLDGFSRFAREHGWNLMLGNRLGPGRMPPCDGAIFTLRGSKGELTLLRQLRRRGIPVVDLALTCPDISLPRVVSDHNAIGRMAAAHFRERGFDNLAWFSSGWSNVHRLRFAGFATGLGNHPRRLTSANMESLLGALPKPLGVLTYDEVDASHILAACRALDLSVPEDVSVLGIGNDPYLCESQSIPISSIEPDLAAGAYRGAELLQRLMSGKRPPKHPVLMKPTCIVSRASTDTLVHPDPTIRQAFAYIHRNLSRPFGSTETATAIGIDRAKLDALFAAKVGHSVGKEILRQRLIRVKRLLKDPTLPVGTIATSCGFCNIGYLSNIFRRETGRTPSDWRKAQSPTARR